VPLLGCLGFTLDYASIKRLKKMAQDVYPKTFPYCEGQRQSHDILKHSSVTKPLSLAFCPCVSIVKAAAPFRLLGRATFSVLWHFPPIGVSCQALHSVRSADILEAVRRTLMRKPFIATADPLQSHQQYSAMRMRTRRTRCLTWIQGSLM